MRIRPGRLLLLVRVLLRVVFLSRDRRLRRRGRVSVLMGLLLRPVRGRGRGAIMLVLVLVLVLVLMLMLIMVLVLVVLAGCVVLVPHLLL